MFNPLNKTLTTKMKKTKDNNSDLYTDRPLDAENIRLRKLNNIIADTLSSAPDVSAISVLVSNSPTAEGISARSSALLNISDLPGKNTDGELYSLAVGLARSAHRTPNLAKVLLLAANMYIDNAKQPQN